ncbi:MAG TPA: carboxymuconolactone decarboxylase family protein [Streptosporangiaceae bacterium]|nr:carboxymuconolactone decarboxylase family protein [Streptosporangiaceae bacterium]
MSRLPYLSYEELNADGRRVWDSVTGSRGDQLVNEHGGLVGPFNAFVSVPEIGRHLSALGAAVRFGTSLERRLSELAIITVGARWKAEFEWWAHARMARRHGVPDEVVDAIGRGEHPSFAADDERIIYAVASQLMRNGRVTAHAYEEARGLIGDVGLVELVSLCGYYTLISYLLNAFDVPLPEGTARNWDDEEASSARGSKTEGE